MNEVQGIENTQRRARGRRLLRGTLIVLVLGLAYYVFYQIAGFGIPCPIHAVTGYLCPGCGMTRAAVALLSGDPYEAMRQNMLSLTVIPVLLAYGVWRVVRYIRRGWSDFAGWEVIIIATLAVVSVGYGITRNIGRTPDPSVVGTLLSILMRM